MSGINELKWQTLTAMINEMKSPRQFLKRLLFSNHETVNTEDIELSTVVAGREVAPLVRKNGEALLVSGHDETFVTVTAPNIRIKRPFTPSELLFGRRPGTVIYPTGDQQLTALQQHVARDMQKMADMVTNAEEYLCSMAIQGQILYSVADEEVFQVTYPVPNANKITLTTFWNDADLTLPAPEEDFTTAKRVANDAVGVNITDAIMGAEAAAAFRKVMLKQNNIATGAILDKGSISFTQNFDQDGVIFIGTFSGIRCWEYSSTLTVNGSSVSLIRSKYVEFVSVSPATERVLYYGAIPDMEALEGKLFVAERFSKSWKIPDPSAMMSLVHSRPLPVLRRPGAGVSMKVVSG